MSKATTFISRCCGITSPMMNMTDAWIALWCRKIKSRSRSVKLDDLPQTTECFEANVKRADHTAGTWLSALTPKPPDVDVTEFGWLKDEETESLLPAYSALDKPFIPRKLENLLACSCSGATPCRGRQCGCHRNHLPCSATVLIHSAITHSPTTAFVMMIQMMLKVLAHRSESVLLQTLILNVITLMMTATIL